jgi:AbrB family looped-hinge helix DNA binding protein
MAEWDGAHLSPTRSNDSAFLLRATMPAAHAVCDYDADPASSKCLLDGPALEPFVVLRVGHRWCYRLSSTQGAIMTVVTISSRFQVVIPKDVRERLDLKPGQQVDAIPYRGRIELIPVEPIESMRGFVRGIDTTVPREGDRV